MTPLLEVEDLRVRIPTDAGVVQAVDGVSFEVEPGRTLALVGESGSGKSITCQSLLGLRPTRRAEASGRIRFKGRDILTAGERELRALRGREIAMVFQDPMTALDPVYSVGDQLVEAMRLHQEVSRRVARARALEMLSLVGIPDAARRIDDYPHQFSGGMRQRVMIGMALINEPDLVVADEPTAALDVTTQAQILRLLRRLQSEVGSAVVLVTHDLGVVGEVADDVVVLYAGVVVERGSVYDLALEPRHPYTWGLLGALPRTAPGGGRVRLAQIPGTLPSPVHPPPGCRFAPRCAYAMPACTAGRPELRAPPSGAARAEACLLDEATKRRRAAEVGHAVSEGPGA